MYPNLTVPVRAQLKRPTLTEGESPYAEVIDFDEVQIGSTSVKSVKIVNPTDDPLVVALFVADEDTY